ncbi:hypothetical protein BKA70DRAFT_785170 [Coprinopsis sp. MPI-PUGE-AT-0042]|nr:hypothetical protein BKA70DRAFT_785170 [Coprinopsis sp. MPI-PUGE-AT-0042]
MLQGSCAGLCKLAHDAVAGYRSRGDTHLQDLVSQDMGDNAGRKLFCDMQNCIQQAIRILIRASGYNDPRRQRNQPLRPRYRPPLLCPSRLNQILDVLAQVYLPRPLQLMLKIPSLHWSTRTEAHETPEYLVLTQDILQVVINTSHNLLVFITACRLGRHRYNRTRGA